MNIKILKGLKNTLILLKKWHIQTAGATQTRYPHPPRISHPSSDNSSRRSRRSRSSSNNSSRTEATVVVVNLAGRDCTEVAVAAKEALDLAATTNGTCGNYTAATNYTDNVPGDSYYFYEVSACEIVFGCLLSEQFSFAVFVYQLNRSSQCLFVH